jgi:transcriptional regulator with XRE-family HTH domain
MFAKWIETALHRAGMTQAELGRRLSARLRDLDNQPRSIDRAAVNKLTKGRRFLMADELLAIAEITGQPLPWTGPDQRRR